MRQRVYCLYRVSTAKQVDYTDTNQADIPVQRKACRDFAEKMGWTIIREEQEAGVSGYKVSADHRDKLQLIRDHAKQKKFDILLVFMFDRLGRKSEETPFVVEWFVKNGIQVWSVNEGEQRFDSHTDRLMNYIRFWQADGESQKISIRTKTALGQMVQEGRFRGGIAPYGYKLVPSGQCNKRRHEVYKLEIDEDEARVVRMMFELCVCSGYGRCKMANTSPPWDSKPVTARTGTSQLSVTFCTTSCTPECFAAAIPTQTSFLNCKSSLPNCLNRRRTLWSRESMRPTPNGRCLCTPTGNHSCLATCSVVIAGAV